MIQESNNASVMMITNIFLPRIVLQPLASSDLSPSLTLWSTYFMRAALPSEPARSFG
jgi:hypothetical protein